MKKTSLPPLSLFRYPGGKSRQSKAIATYFDKSESYCEPCCGAGSVFLRILRNPTPPSKIWLNDLDPDIYAIWESISAHPRELQAELTLLSPSVEVYRDLLANPGTTLPMRAARRIALHQWSFSGLGPRAGSPIGGWEQKGKWKIDCRWNMKLIKSKVTLIHERMATMDVKCTSQDAISVIDECDYDIYVDPPYVGVGDQLYTHGIDHTALRDALLRRSNKWMASYDDHPLILDLYGDAAVSVPIGYTMSSKRSASEYRCYSDLDFADMLRSIS